MSVTNFGFQRQIEIAPNVLVSTVPAAPIAGINQRNDGGLDKNFATLIAFDCKISLFSYIF